MLTISSISVSPWPQQAPTVKAQPVAATKSSNAVSQDNAGVSVSVSGAVEGGAVQAAYAPSALPPVDPTAESAATLVPANSAEPQDGNAVVQSALAQRDAVKNTENQAVQTQQAALSQQADAQQAAEVAQQARAQAARFAGELPVEIKYPEQKALDTQINDLVPNLWKASSAAVEVLIGDDAKAAAAARAEVFDKMSGAAAADALAAEAAQEAADTYAAQQAAGVASQAPGSVLSENA